MLTLVFPLFMEASPPSPLLGAWAMMNRLASHGLIPLDGGVFMMMNFACLLPILLVGAITMTPLIAPNMVAFTRGLQPLTR